MTRCDLCGDERFPTEDGEHSETECLTNRVERLERAIQQNNSQKENDD